MDAYQQKFPLEMPFHDFCKLNKLSESDQKALLSMASLYEEPKLEIAKMLLDYKDDIGRKPDMVKTRATGIIGNIFQLLRKMNGCLMMEAPMQEQLLYDVNTEDASIFWSPKLLFINVREALDIAAGGLSFLLEALKVKQQIFLTKDCEFQRLYQSMSMAKIYISHLGGDQYVEMKETFHEMMWLLLHISYVRARGQPLELVLNLEEDDGLILQLSITEAYSY